MWRRSFAFAGEIWASSASCEMRCDDFFHCFEATDALRKYFGLKGVPAALLRELGVEVPAECVERRGYTYPRLTTLPMGFGPSPGIAQAAHEAVLYGKEGTGSEHARQLEPVVCPAARWSGQRVPDVESAEASKPHALVIDDLIMFRQVLPRYMAGGVAVGTTLASVLTRYDQVGLRTKPEQGPGLRCRAGHARLHFGPQRTAGLVLTVRRDPG